MNEKIIEQYDREVDLYFSFTRKIKDLIVEILKENDLNIHSVTHRVKDRDSLIKKLSKPESIYSNLRDVTDISGVRVITYFEDDVDKVAQLIEQEFEIDSANSVDKRALLDPDRFGYLSMHHVVNLLSARCQLIEYRRFPSFKAEIQTRSILQHAWAEIEHDLGYKSRQEVPKLIRRKFSRLAGLLELVDQEFITIRDELNIYEVEVPERIEKTPQLVTIDKASLAAFVSNNELVNKIDSVLASLVNATILKDDDGVSRLVKMFQYFHIETIAEVESTMAHYADQIVEFAQEWLRDKEYPGLIAGISLHYLGYILIAQTNMEGISNYVTHFNFDTLDNRPVLIQRIMDTYKIISEKVPRDGEART